MVLLEKKKSYSKVQTTISSAVWNCMFIKQISISHITSNTDLKKSNFEDEVLLQNIICLIAHLERIKVLYCFKIICKCKEES